ncbi:MAG TPA: NAD(P)-dependent oxidoreductase, partial [Chloroflexota bacterium]|nr:NAD(P)-dependent oxidoreductase [Chloroflexota bacterium]
MRIVITGGQSRLARALAATFGTEHDIRLTAEGPGESDGAAPMGQATPEDVLYGDLRDPAFATRATEDAEVLFHLAPLWPGLSESVPDGELLDRATRGTFVLLAAAVNAGVRRVVLASTLDLFDAYPSDWWISEAWQPRPSTDVRQLSAYLAEASTREFSRVEPIHAVCLRLGRVVDDADVAGQPYDPRWLHVEDAVQAFQRALAFDLSSRQFATTGPPLHGWWVFHIPGAGEWTQLPLAHARLEPFAYRPAHTFADAGGVDEGKVANDDPPSVVRPWPLLPRSRHVRISSRPVHRVVVFGAGGPLASATAPVLARSYTVRLTDVRPLRDIAMDSRRIARGEPLPTLLESPHDIREVDVADPAQVLSACEGMDAIVNCSVVRPHPVQAFRVNTLGAYNIMRAAVAHRIRRVVQTGPQQVTMDRPGGYWWDFDVPDDAPPRPGSLLYSHSKYLGQEICRIFAEEHSLEVPVLLFSRFVTPETARPNVDGIFPMTVSWRDAGAAILRALEVPALP